MVHGLYEEPEKEMMVGTLDNNEDIELDPGEKMQKSNIPNTNKKKKSGTKNKILLSFFIKER